MKVKDYLKITIFSIIIATIITIITNSIIIGLIIGLAISILLKELKKAQMKHDIEVLTKYTINAIDKEKTKKEI